MRYPATFSALIQKLTAKTDSIDSIDSKLYLQHVINPLLVFKKFSDLIEDTGFRIRRITKCDVFQATATPRLYQFSLA